MAGGASRAAVGYVEQQLYDDDAQSHGVSAAADAVATMAWSMPLPAPVLLDQWGLLSCPPTFETAFSLHRQAGLLPTACPDGYHQGQQPQSQQQQQQQQQRQYQPHGPTGHAELSLSTVHDPPVDFSTASSSTMAGNRPALEYLGSAQRRLAPSHDLATTATVQSNTSYFDAGAYLQPDSGDMTINWTGLASGPEIPPLQPARASPVTDHHFLPDTIARHATELNHRPTRNAVVANAIIQEPQHTPPGNGFDDAVTGRRSPSSLKLDDDFASSPGSARSGDTNVISEPGSWIFVDHSRGLSGSPEYTDRSHEQLHGHLFVNPSQMMHNRSTMSLALSDSSFSDLGGLNPAEQSLPLGNQQPTVLSRSAWAETLQQVHRHHLFETADAEMVNIIQDGLPIPADAIPASQSRPTQHWTPPAPWSDDHFRQNHQSIVDPIRVVRRSSARLSPSTGSTSSSNASRKYASDGLMSRKSSMRRRPALTAKNMSARVRKCAHTHSNSMNSVGSNGSSISLLSATGSVDGVHKKRVGKRTGPLKPDQRKQASEIRKLRACLRCKFLKKTCDKGEPCAGCQPSHARLWQVPCTRIDIKEIAYFLKDWKADYSYLPPSESPTPSLASLLALLESTDPTTHASTLCSWGDYERTLFITHGYGHTLPVRARELCVTDETCLEVDWVETYCSGTGVKPPHFRQVTSRLCCTDDSISPSLLSEYLDQHLDMPGSFEQFVDGYFAGTPFVTEMLKTAFRFYVRTNSPIMRKALKLVIAYNLTLNVTLLEGVGELDLHEHIRGQVRDQSSLYAGRIMAPILINFAIKRGLAKIWRELQKEVLQDLSSLYSSVYSGEKLKNWPTIFFLAVLILGVWEEIQFDSHYRMGAARAAPDPRCDEAETGADAQAVPGTRPSERLCADMEGTPIGVIVGLFQAISQKAPPFIEWDTALHGHLFGQTPEVCDALTEVRQHVTHYEPYLRSRGDCKFNADDFDSLSNKFIARLMIRTN